MTDESPQHYVDEDANNKSGVDYVEHATYPKYTPGVAPIKPQFLVFDPNKVNKRKEDVCTTDQKPDVFDDSTADGSLMEGDSNERNDNGEPVTKRPKLKGAARKRARREEARQNSGGGSQNKNRHFAKVKDDIRLCSFIVSGRECPDGEQCKLSHDLVTYMIKKPFDLPFPAPPPTSNNVDITIAGTLRGLATDEEREQYLQNVYSTEAPFLQSNNRNDEKQVSVNEKDQENTFDVTSTTILEPCHSAEGSTNASLDPKTNCPVLDSRKQAASVGAPSGLTPHVCPSGYKCRFLGAHSRITENTNGNAQERPHSNGTDSKYCGIQLVPSPEAFITERKESNHQPERLGISRHVPDESNYPSEGVLRLLRSKKYPLPLTKIVLNQVDREREIESRNGGIQAKGPIIFHKDELDKAKKIDFGQSTANNNGANMEADMDEIENSILNASNNNGVSASDLGALTRANEAALTSSQGDIDTARVRPFEKRRLNWGKHNELYLAPLTTTGNLPFRRICASFGSDIHCGEMGLSESFLEGKSSEWSLVRRWEGEKCFGTQLCGSKPNFLVPAAEALANEIGNGLDFVDVNCGCPIDLVYNRGGGSALLDAPGKLGKIVRGMSAVLHDTPVTVKLRTGTTPKNTVHKIFPRLQTEWGVGAVTLHGRSRQQRYAKRADWTYIRTCANALRESVQRHNEEASTAEEPELHTIPIYGNGDVFSWQEYYSNLEHTGVDGEMIARGALIKPWIFTEIKEKRDWDISSRERLDIVRQYCSAGLSHWGSDTQGVNTTRRFLCESLSFMHRYVPVGLLEHLPASMNDRPPAYRGRDELETLLSSDNAADWVRISEMFLGKAPQEWNFVPKHKSNSYDTTEQQG